MACAESGDASDNPDSDGEFVTIKTRWVVSNAHQKHWVPSTKEASDGRVYIKLTKFDRSLVMFALGKGMQGKRNANVEAFDRLLEARKAASVQAVQAATDDSENTGTKKRKVRAEDQSLLAASHVTIDVPEVRFQNQTMGGYGMRCLWGIDSSCLWVELCKSNLKYMKAIICLGQGQGGKTRSNARVPKSPKKSRSPKSHSPKKSQSPKLRRLKAMSASPRRRSDDSPAESHPKK